MSLKKHTHFKRSQSCKEAIYFALDVESLITDAVRTELKNNFDFKILKSSKVFLEVKFRKPAIILLDCSEGSLQVLKKLRAHPEYKRIAVIMIDRNPNRSNCILAFNSGCDDYFDEMYPVEECVARIRAVLRRMAQPEVSKSDKIIFGDVILEVENKSVFVNGNLINLTPKEFRILEVLIKSAGGYVRRPDLLQAVWGKSGHLVLLESQISLLRKKISGSNCKIKSRYRVGVGIFNDL